MSEEIKKFPYRLLDFVIMSVLYIKILMIKTDYALDFDLGWHLKTGEWIWQNKAVPFFDPFLASNEPRAWVCDQWLGDLVLYFLHSNFDWVGPTFLVLFIFMVLFFYFVYDFCLKQSKSAYITIFVACISFTEATIHLIIRPVVYSFLFFALLLIKLNTIEIESKKTNQWLLTNSDVLKVFLLFVLWSNTHPSFFLGLLLIFLFVFSACTEKVLKLNDVPSSFIKKSILLFVSGIFATLCNPNGINLHFSILKLINSQYYTNLYYEWARPSFTDIRFIILASSFLIIIISWIISKGKDLFKSIFNLGLILLAGYLMFKAYRMFPYVAILLAYPLSMALKNIFDKYYGVLSKFKFSKILVEVNEIEVNGKSLVMSGACILTLVFSWYFIHFNKSYLFEPKKCKSVIMALQKIANSIPAGETRVILTGINYGGLVPYYGEGKLKAIIDDRSTMFDEEYFKMVVKKVSSKDEWFELFNEVNAEYFLLSNKSKIKSEVQKVLDIAYSNKKVTVFKKK